MVSVTYLGNQFATALVVLRKISKHAEGIAHASHEFASDIFLHTNPKVVSILNTWDIQLAARKENLDMNGSVSRQEMRCYLNPNANCMHRVNHLGQFLLVDLGDRGNGLWGIPS